MAPVPVWLCVRRIHHQKSAPNRALPRTLARSHGYGMTLLAFSLNLVLVWVALWWAGAVVRVIAEAGARAAAKVFGLLLGAIGVTLVRHGLEQVLIGG
jgi:small neutral amino acid transporter SnatA (MarC family)